MNDGSRVYCLYYCGTYQPDEAFDLKRPGAVRDMLCSA